MPSSGTPMASTSVMHHRQCTVFRAGGGRVACPARAWQRTCAQAATATVTAPEATASRNRSHTTDVVVIGSGIGGLSCASMLSSAYGRDVTVLESHSIPGGAAHAWVQDGYHFESGPSLYSGMAARGRAANPLSHVMQAIGESLDLIEYNCWNLVLPEGQFITEIGNDQFEGVIQQISGDAAVAEWRHLQEVMRPLAKAATTLPPAAIRLDPGAALTVGIRYAPQFLGGGWQSFQLLKPFSEVLDKEVKLKDPFVRRYMDLLCFLLSGLPANGTITAEIAFMFNEWYRPGACLEFPRGGSQAMVNALVRGVKKSGGKVMLNAHVEEILVEDGKAVGVRLADSSVVRANTVVSNASSWDTLKLLPASAVPAEYQKTTAEMPINRSFMHLHLGFDAAGLPDDLIMHHIVVDRWEDGVDADQNVVLISIPSLTDPALAPPGKHTLHAYLPATEPWEQWEGLERGTPEYEERKQQRSALLYRAVEKIIPDIRERIEISMVGTPLTHRHFLRRHQGTYGPGIVAGQSVFPFQKTALNGLLAVGDCTFPGIGLPAVAASGTIAANSLVNPFEHWSMLQRIGT